MAASNSNDANSQPLEKQEFSIKIEDKPWQ